MLLPCPECQLQVSDKAASCPHCGYPLQPTKYKSRTKPKKNHKRLPNGFGQITLIKGKNLRKPYRAMVTVGKTELGRPICQLLKPEAYFETYNDAYEALVKYNRSPYDMNAVYLVSEIFEMWLKEYKESVTAQVIACTKSNWKYCHEIYNMPIREIRMRHIGQCIENGYIVTKTGEKKFASAVTQVHIKNIFNVLLDYAVRHEYVEKNYARDYKLPSHISSKSRNAQTPHISFTDEEIGILWKNISDPVVAMIIIQCYTGFRPQELCAIRRDDIDIEHWTIRGGMKTVAGTNRIVPIHSAIQSLVKQAYDLGKNNTSGLLYEINYLNYYRKFVAAMSEYKLNDTHRPHDPRKYFITVAKKYRLNDFAIKRIVGHKIADVTESIYTERTTDWLREEIEKIIVE